MNEIAGQAAGMIYGSGPYQDHHGGALWLQDSQGWFLVRNQAGIEWSAQFCADPAKVDLLRQNAQRLYNLVSPQSSRNSIPAACWTRPITDAAGVATWTDSIFNAGVPLHPNFHTGVLPAGGDPEPGRARWRRTEPARAGDPEPAGVHHYPTPIIDIQLFKYDDFQLWVTDRRVTRPRSLRWTSGAAATPASTCSTQLRARNWPSKSMKRKALAPR